jgi:membrane protease subunit HflC
LPISEVITKDKQTMVADCFALWRITDPQKFISSLNGSMPNATSRIEVLVYNAMKNEMSSRTQAEIISDRTGKLASDITEVAKPNFSQYGIELIAVETKHLDLPYDNKESVYNRMISERANISAGHTAEGEKEATILRATAEKEARIARAEGEAQALERLYSAQARGIAMIKEAAPSKEYLTLESLKAYEKLADGQATKLIVPSDLQNLAATLTSAKEMLGVDQK